VDLIERLREAARVQWEVEQGKPPIERFIEWEAADELVRLQKRHEVSLKQATKLVKQNHRIAELEAEVMHWKGMTKGRESEIDQRLDELKECEKIRIFNLNLVVQQKGELKQAGIVCGNALTEIAELAEELKQARERIAAYEREWRPVLRAHSFIDYSVQKARLSDEAQAALAAIPEPDSMDELKQAIDEDRESARPRYASAPEPDKAP